MDEAEIRNTYEENRLDKVRVLVLGRSVWTLTMAYFFPFFFGMDVTATSRPAQGTYPIYFFPRTSSEFTTSTFASRISMAVRHVLPRAFTVCRSSSRTRDSPCRG